jgi:transposase
MLVTTQTRSEVSDMLNTNYTEKLLGLQEVKVKKIWEDENNFEIEVEQPRKMCVCPSCGAKTDKVHDYRRQRVKELPAFGKTVVILLHKRRYACSCGKRFAEPNSFLARYQRMTKRVMMGILEKLSDSRSYTAVAKEFNLSTPTVIRLFKNVQYSKPTKLPEVIGIDEFKGNSGGEKFHGILTDLGDRKVIDILKTRYGHDLCDYFRKYDRSNVKYFVSDMYKPYAEIAATYFPNATYVIDRYHWIRQAIWAFEAVRKEVQKRFSKKHRIYFKKSRHLLLKHQDKLKEEELQQVLIMLDISPTLSTAYFLKEQLYAILNEPDPNQQKKLFSDWIEEATESEIPSFVRCAKTYCNWFTPITNSFFCPYTNGFTEGCNNKIKVLKRNAYGLQDFRRFRNRILFMFSHQGGADA